ncbi:unnamed protein product [Amoebophrya sp. A120]|nr:unnamed protein product [Amoebophrya sp. A120]|eukprot:GSA120T00018586001.1
MTQISRMSGVRCLLVSTISTSIVGTAHLILFSAQQTAAASVRRKATSSLLHRQFQRHEKRRKVRQTAAASTPFPFYHTTQEIHTQLLALQSRCHGWITVATKGSDPQIDVVSIRKTDSSPPNRFFLLFGEHARELISPESGLHFLQTLCGESDLAKTDGARYGTERMAELLDTTEFQLVVNGNPDSRQRVENGEYCLRVNTKNGVDLNRNWDDRWEPAEDEMSPDTNPGPKPFSENETQIFKTAVADFKPTGFLTIHSGTRGMYSPWAYDMRHEAVRNGPAMLNMLQQLDANYCKCPFGAAGKEVGYSCPGTCLDYVYDKLGVDYAFAFEIYGNPAENFELEQRFDEIVDERKLSSENALTSSISAVGKDEKKPNYLQLLQEFGASTSKKRHDTSAAASLLHQHQHRHHRASFSTSAKKWREEGCLAQFNPTTESDFKDTVENWTQVYVNLAKLVAADAEKRAGVTADVSLVRGRGEKERAFEKSDFPVWKP